MIILWCLYRYISSHVKKNSISLTVWSFRQQGRRRIVINFLTGAFLQGILFSTALPGTQTTFSVQGVYCWRDYLPARRRSHIVLLFDSWKSNDDEEGEDANGGALFGGWALSAWRMRGVEAAETGKHSKSSVALSFSPHNPYPYYLNTPR